MPRWNSALNATLKEYGQYLLRKRCRERTVQEYKRIIRKAFRELNEAGLSCSPKTVGEEEIDYLYSEMYEPLIPKVARMQISIVGTFLKRTAMNPIVERMEIPWPEDTRVHARWMEPIHCIALRNCAVGLERILVHFELDCMMRRCEVLRLTVEDVKDGRIDIWGKGRSGGKPRSVPWHPRTGQEWMYYLKLREGLIAKARETNPTLVIPDEVMIYERRGELHPYRKTAIDRMVKNVGERAMIPKEEISNHVLRRSGARIHKRAGTPTATIMKILGHKTEEQTQRYLGLNLDDMSEGMVKAEEFMMGLEGTVPGHAPSGFKP